jgi:protein-S-isoprenylcysteine O-methyltransferase Ste14
MIAFWAAPVMTIAHFIFASICTMYMITAIQFEERDLVASFGEQYTRYRERAPMLIPFLKKRR